MAVAEAGSRERERADRLFRSRLRRTEAGARALPVCQDDNYVTVMPGYGNKRIWGDRQSRLMP